MLKYVYPVPNSLGNVLVSVTDGGDAIDFHPSISLMDGHLAELAGVYDFSVYEETPDERSVEIATEILLEYGEVRQGLENGMKLMYTGESDRIYCDYGIWCNFRILTLRKPLLHPVLPR